MIVSFVRVYVFTKMVKEKPNSIRIYDDEGFRRRAACICVRSDAETEVNVTTMLFISPLISLLVRQTGVNVDFGVGAVGDVVAAAGQLDRARRRRRTRGGAVSNGDARGAGGSRRHRQAGPLSWGF